MLISRLIDRPIRPLFPEGFRNEVQVVATVLSHDLENDPDIVAMIGCSAALTLSGIPFFGPVAAARVGYKDGQYILNPTADADEGQPARTGGRRHAGRRADGGIRGAGAVRRRHARRRHLRPQRFQPVIQAIIELAEHAAKEPWPLPEPSEEEQGAEGTRRRAGPRRPGRGLSASPTSRPATTRSTPSASRSLEALAAEGLRRREGASALFKDLEADIVRNAILDTGMRIDGRDTKTVRPIVAEVGVLPRAHGSALFTRGETQALCVATLGTGQDEQIIDALEGEYREHFMLHYNFPPYSVGEAGRMGIAGPARDRPRQAGLARDPSAAAGEGEVPLHAARGLGDHRNQRLVLDGDGVRRRRWR